MPDRAIGPASELRSRTMDPAVAPAIPAHVMVRIVGDEAVLLNLQTGTYFGLDPVGARYWQLLSEGRQLSEIIRALLDEYDVAEERLQQDLRALVAQLLENGLLQPGPG
jgi:hypothetical protein